MCDYQLPLAAFRCLKTKNDYLGHLAALVVAICNCDYVSTEFLKSKVLVPFGYVVAPVMHPTRFIKSGIIKNGHHTAYRQPITSSHNLAISCLSIKSPPLLQLSIHHLVETNEHSQPYR